MENEEIDNLAKDMDNEAEENLKLDFVNLGKRKWWYNRTFILFAMMEHLRGRESAFLCRYTQKHNIRNLNWGSVEIILKNLGIQTNTEKLEGKKAQDPFDFFSERKNYRIYGSCGVYDWEKMPVKALSYAISERKKQQMGLTEDYRRCMVDYTPCCDLDGNLNYEVVDGKEIKGDLEISQEECCLRALEEAKIIIDLFNEYKIEWYINFSGTKGFHLWYKIPLKIHPLQKIDVGNRIKKMLHEILNLETLDLYPEGTRKLIKAPYSLETNHGVTRVILPLDNNQIQNWDLAKTESSWIYYNIRDLKTRGLIYRNTEVPESEKIKLFKKFCEDFEIEIPKLEDCREYNKEPKDLNSINTINI